MRRWVLPLLVLANVGLTLWLASLWFTPDGRPIDVRWKPPAPVPPTLDAAEVLPATGVELSRYVATLERPLFSPSRRPPPPEAASAAPVVDTPPDLHVLGLYGTHTGSGDGATEPRGGVIARVDGQVKRLKVGDAIGRWTLKALRPPGEVVLALGDVEQAYLLQRTAASPPPSASADNAPTDSSPSLQPQRPAANPYYQRQVDEARANVRRVNALRARSGLPPLPEP